MKRPGKKVKKLLADAEDFSRTLIQSKLRRIRDRVAKKIRVKQEPASYYGEKGYKYRLVICSEYIDHNPVKATDELRSLWTAHES